MALYEHVFLTRQDASAQQVEELTTQFQSVDVVKTWSILDLDAILEFINSIICIYADRERCRVVFNQTEEFNHLLLHFIVDNVV